MDSLEGDPMNAVYVLCLPSVPATGFCWLQGRYEFDIFARVFWRSIMGSTITMTLSLGLMTFSFVN